MTKDVGLITSRRKVSRPLDLAAPVSHFDIDIGQADLALEQLGQIAGALAVLAVVGLVLGDEAPIRQPN